MLSEAHIPQYLFTYAFVLQRVSAAFNNQLLPPCQNHAVCCRVRVSLCAVALRFFVLYCCCVSLFAVAALGCARSELYDAGYDSGRRQACVKQS